MIDNYDRKGWGFWLLIGFPALFFLLAVFLGSAFAIGDKLGRIHPVIAWSFYIALFGVVVWFIVIPLVDVFTLPLVSLEKLNAHSSSYSDRTLKKVARQLIRQGRLPDEHRWRLSGALDEGSSLWEPLSNVIAAQRESAVKIIHDQAVLVFVSTALSQNGRLDSIVLLAVNFRLVRSLLRQFGYRPPLPVLVKVYAQIFLAGLIADQIDDLDVQAPSFLSAIPAATLIVNSGIDGILNAWLTLRIGYVAIRCLMNVGEPLSNTEIRKSANSQARKALEPVVKDALPKITSAVQGIIKF